LTIDSLEVLRKQLHAAKKEIDEQNSLIEYLTESDAKKQNLIDALEAQGIHDRIVFNIKQSETFNN